MLLGGKLSFDDLAAYKIAVERRRLGKHIKNNKKYGRIAESEIKKALREAGFYVSVKGISTAGVDILAIKDGVALLVEVKATGGNKVTIYERQVKLLFATAEEIRNKTSLDPKCYIAVKFRNKGWYVLNLLSNWVSGKVKVYEKDAELMSLKEVKGYFACQE